VVKPAALACPKCRGYLEDFFEPGGKQPLHVKFWAGGQKAAEVSRDRPDVELGGRSGSEQGCLDFEESFAFEEGANKPHYPAASFQKAPLTVKGLSFVAVR
jgi:hypothetical protein